MKRGRLSNLAVGIGRIGAVINPRSLADLLKNGYVTTYKYDIMFLNN